MATRTTQLCLILLIIVTDAQPNVTEQLIVIGNNIYVSASNVLWDGKGVNLPDIRACGAGCSRSKKEVIRRVDYLLDDLELDWIRLNLQANDVDGNALSDSAYWQDIKDVVAHVGSKYGKYVEVSVWKDPSLCEPPSNSSDGENYTCKGGDRQLPGGPSNKTAELWVFMAKHFKNLPHVIIGIVNEPRNTTTRESATYLYRSMNYTVQKIRETGAQNLILVQCLHYSTDCNLYLDNPITAGNGTNIAYEIHLYSAEKRTDQLLLDGLPIVVSETAVIYDKNNSLFATTDDYEYIVQTCRDRGIPYAGWSFDEVCGPVMLDGLATKTNGCGSKNNLSLHTAWGRFFLGGHTCSNKYC